MFMYAPFAKTIGQPDMFTYQDYLYELCADGYNVTPVSEQQWEMVCDMIGRRKMMHSSTSKAIMERIVRKRTEDENAAQ
jgi:crotonobetainyl-CoA:carnitine CoA-transferase CaiB-like acyl-CoA transferase